MVTGAEKDPSEQCVAAETAKSAAPTELTDVEKGSEIENYKYP